MVDDLTHLVFGSDQASNGASQSSCWFVLQEEALRLSSVSEHLAREVNSRSGAGASVSYSKH